MVSGRSGTHPTSSGAELDLGGDAGADVDVIVGGGVFENSIITIGILNRNGVLLYLVEVAHSSLIASITE